MTTIFGSVQKSHSGEKFINVTAKYFMIFFKYLSWMYIHSYMYAADVSYIHFVHSYVFIFLFDESSETNVCIS